MVDFYEKRQIGLEYSRKTKTQVKMEAGKIYWLLGDFKMLNSDEPDYWHSFAKVEDGTWITSPELIKFHTIPKNFDSEELIGYSLTLQPSIGNNFEGAAKFSDSGEKAADVKCELFDNSKKHLMKGTWIEDGEIFTWVLILDKSKK